MLVKVGDKVSKEQSLITVESDKASMEIPASDDGVVTKLLVKVGDKVSKGSEICEISGAGEAAESNQQLQRRPNRLLHPYQAHQLQLQAQPAVTVVRLTTLAMCWCWVRAPVVIPQPSEVPTLA